MIVVVSTMTPKPETLNVYLASSGYKNKLRITKHIFHEARETTIDGPRGEAWEFIFKCLETGAERRFGIVDRLSFSGMEEGN